MGIQVKKKYISIIIPVFNSTKSLNELLRKILKIPIKKYEIIFVDDCSENLETQKTLTNLAKKHKNIIKVIFLSKNLGRTNAVLTGLNYASGIYNIIMDDDLEHDPKYINKFLKLKNHDVVFASYSRNKDFFNNVMSYLKYLLDKITFENKVRISSYFMINARIRKFILNTSMTNPYLPGLINSATIDIVSFNINLNKRKYDRSNFNFVKKIKIIKNIFINYSNLPYKILFFLGSSTLLISFFLGINIIYNYINYSPQPGWTSITFLVIFFSSINLIFSGLIGYITFSKLNNLSSQKNNHYYIKKIISHE